jgi:hypothetical protein
MVAFKLLPIYDTHSFERSDRYLRPRLQAGFTCLIVLTVNQAVEDGIEQTPLAERFVCSLSPVGPPSLSLASDSGSLAV